MATPSHFLKNKSFSNKNQLAIEWNRMSSKMRGQHIFTFICFLWFFFLNYVFLLFLKIGENNLFLKTIFYFTLFLKTILRE